MTIYAPKPTSHTELKYLTKVAKSQGEELSTVTSKEEVYWKSTCERCAYRGNRHMLDDWYGLDNPNGSDRKIYREVARFAERCTECDTKSRRYSRMTASLNKILDIKDHVVRKSDYKFGRPKMITIGNDQGLSLEEFKKRFKLWRDNSPWLIGGTYVFEKGSKNGMWHSHGIYIAPVISKKQLPDWCATSMKFGLGRMNYKVARYSKKWKNSGLCNYIAKYMCKDGNRKQSFAALYRCEIERLERPDGSIKKIWTQPSAITFQAQIRDWKKGEGKQWQ